MVMVVMIVTDSHVDGKQKLSYHLFTFDHISFFSKAGMFICYKNYLQVVMKSLTLDAHFPIFLISQPRLDSVPMRLDVLSYLLSRKECTD